jgi:hypothetical protein
MFLLLVYGGGVVDFVRVLIMHGFLLQPNGKST